MFCLTDSHNALIQIPMTNGSNCTVSVRTMVHEIPAPVCNPTLQVIGLQMPCVEKAGVAVDALQLLKY